MNKAVFLDRDGVINKERSDYVKTVSELEILSNISRSIKLLKDAGFLVIVITNQSAINRGLTTHENVKNIHNAIQEFLKKNGTAVDGFYYCPHISEENCLCRKPKPGLLQKAAQEFDIELKSSWMIGNNDSDVEAAINAGCKAIKINTTKTLKNAIFEILAANSEKILKN